MRSKHFKGSKCNTFLHFVPHQYAWVVERMGKFHRILEPGVHFVCPFIDTIRYQHCLKEMCIEIPQQEAITKDNVQLDLDAVLYVRVVDPYKASYGVQDPEYAISQLAQTVMRSEVGQLMLDNVFHERANLNMAIVEGIKESAQPWGLICLRYEIRTMNMPPEIQRAMKMQVEAERKKRAMILESEGISESEKNKAEGEKKARILRSEAQMQEQVNKSLGLAKAAEGEKAQRILQSEAEMQMTINAALASAKSAESEKESRIVLAQAEEQVQIIQGQGLAKAIGLEAEARAKALERMAEGIEKAGGTSAASFVTADNFVKAFGNLAKESNTLIIPSNSMDITGMVTQAMSIYNKVADASKHSTK